MNQLVFSADETAARLPYGALAQEIELLLQDPSVQVPARLVSAQSDAQLRARVCGVPAEFAPHRENNVGAVYSWTMSRFIVRPSKYGRLWPPSVERASARWAGRVTLSISCHCNHLDLRGLFEGIVRTLKHTLLQAAS